MTMINPDPPPDEDVGHVSEGLRGSLQLKVELPPQGAEPDLHRDPGLLGAAHISLVPCNLLVLKLRQKY